jgi:shikimate dehydrogenase
MPFKEVAAVCCASLDPLAAAIGAVNTLVRETDGWHGFNTDAGAVLGALSSVTDLAGARIAIVGAGGAARAAAFALRAEGADLTLCSRTRSRADDLAGQVGARSASIDILEAEHHDVVINATPVGMGLRGGDEPVTPFRVEWLRGDEIVFDFVYRPRETPLLVAARERGCRTIEGLEMFVRQAAEQYRLWTGADSAQPLDIMWRAAEKALQ